MPLAIFGLRGGIGLFVNLLILFLVVVYLALIWWTYLDARRRIEDPVLIACATAASVFPFLGTVVYTILRPPEYLEDREERELELRAAELELRQRIENSCPHCEYPIERSYLRCPNCERRLRTPCRKCHKPLDPTLGNLPLLRDPGPQAAAPGARGTARPTERARNVPPGSAPPAHPAPRIAPPRTAHLAARTARRSGRGRRSAPAARAASSRPETR